MPNRKKGDLDRVIPVCQYSPGQILNRSIILILTSTVVSIEMDHTIIDAMVFNVVMDIADNSICLLPCVHCLIH